MPTKPDVPMGSDWEFARGHGAQKTYALGEAPLTALRLEHWLNLKPMDEGLWWLRIGDARLMVQVGDKRVVLDIIRGFYEPVTGTTELPSPTDQG